jgi:hypothetical protein
LLRHHFFALRDNPSNAVDIQESIVSVQRCDVTIVVHWPSYSNEDDVLAIVAELDKIVQRIKWQKADDGKSSPESVIAPIP